MESEIPEEVAQEIANLQEKKVITEKTAQLYLSDLKKRTKESEPAANIEEEVKELQKQNVISEPTGQIYLSDIKGRLSPKIKTSE